MDSSGRHPSKVTCKACKRRNQWKGSNSRSQPYEKDTTCDHQTSRRTCPRCYTQIPERADGTTNCPNPGCSQRHELLDSFETFCTSKSSVQKEEPREARRSQTPLILRTGCLNCRLVMLYCSGSVTGPRCSRCSLLGLECDCKVLRKTCEECMKDRGKATWKRCVGIRDACDVCIEKGIECKEFIRGAEKEVAVNKEPRDALADGPIDVIDGIKAVTAFASCGRCLDENMVCDQRLPGCSGCIEKGIECNYKLLATTISDFSVERTKQRRFSNSRLSQQAFEGENLEKAPLPRPNVPTTCGPCRKSKSICYGFDPTCFRCQSLDLECAPKVKPFRDVAEPKLLEIALENEFEQLEKMMSELELDGWHIVSREEVEGLSESKS